MESMKLVLYRARCHNTVSCRCAMHESLFWINVETLTPLSLREEDSLKSCMHIRCVVDAKRIFRWARKKKTTLIVEQSDFSLKCPFR